MASKLYFVLVLAGLCVPGCCQNAVDNLANNLRITWSVSTNSPTSQPLLPYEGTIELVNEGQTMESGLDWEIYFCSIRILFPTIITEDNPDVGVVFGDTNILVYHVNGCLHKLQPLSNFTGFFPQVPIILEYEASDWSVARTDIMPRWYVASSSGDAKTILSTTNESLDFVGDYDTPEKWKRIVQEDQYNPFTPEGRYDRNMANDNGSPAKLVLPTPEYAVYDSTFDVDIATGDWVVVYSDQSLQGEAEFLADKLGIQALDADNKPSDRYIEVNTGNVMDANGQIINNTEAYEMTVLVEEYSILIIGSSSHGTFNGIQTLLSLSSYSNKIPAAVIVDYPRFPYRGMHLDPSRNFVDKVEVLRLLEVMAMYKMNRFHFHLSDDEGWRLEFPTLPELTETGSKRCFSLDPDECLISQLGSGPSTSTSGSGFYSVEDYQDILRFAQARHIEVIPEFEMPGHGYAAIKSMEARYNKYKDTDMGAATEFLLADLNDTSTYLSAQIYRDNAINPCINSTYAFVKEVVEQIKAVHQDIQPLQTFHFGGDEVADGAWLESPACLNFINQNPDLELNNSTKFQLHQYFVFRVADIVHEAGLNLGGWEDGLGHLTTPINRTDLPNERVLVYAWNNIWEEGNGERAYAYANQNYDVVISHASHFYFDHPQEPDPEERGYYWATRYIDTQKTFSYYPDDVYENIEETLMGQPIDKEAFCASEDRCIPLDDNKRDNIIGVQGQLFSETCRTASQLQNQVYPRILALAERAWHKASWEETKDTEQKAVDWEKFANTLSYKELKRLDQLGIDYYIPPPGARITETEGVYSLEVNVNFPGLPMMYTTNEGNTWSTIKAGVPVTVQPDQVIQIQVRSADGSRGSRSVMLQTPGQVSLASALGHSGITMILAAVFYVSSRI